MEFPFEKDLLEEYLKKFTELRIAPVQGGRPMNHCSWMVVEMLNKLPTSTEKKLNRWIGFIQGVLWREGFFSIDQLREHVQTSQARAQGGSQ